MEIREKVKKRANMLHIRRDLLSLICWLLKKRIPMKKIPAWAGSPNNPQGLKDPASKGVPCHGKIRLILKKWFSISWRRINRIFRRRKQKYILRNE